MPSTVNAFSALLAPFTWKPPSTSPELTDGAVSAIDWNERLFGRRSNSSAVTLWPMSVLRVSTSGAACAVTWTVSVSCPTRICASRLNDRPRRTLMSRRSKVVKPLSSNATV